MSGYINGKVDIWYGDSAPSNQNVLWQKRIVTGGVESTIMYEFNNNTGDWQVHNKTELDKKINALDVGDIITHDESEFSLIEHNHNLNDLSEKSYNSLTDKPSIPSIDGLATVEQVNAISTGLIYQTPVDSIADLGTTYPTPTEGWAAMVTDENLIYSWNGSQWVNTGLSGFPEDVATKDYAVKKIIGKNKLDTSKSDVGHFIWSYGGIGDNADYAITDFIPVTGDVIMNLPQVDGTGNEVFDAAKVSLRIFTTPQYTFQSGDAFVKFSYDTRTSCQIEEGNEATLFEPFTDKGDVVSRIVKIENIVPIEYGIDDIKILTSPVEQGLIQRKYGFDIPVGSTGAGSLSYIKFPKVDGSFTCDFYMLTNIPIDKFYIDSGWGFTGIQESTGVIKFTKLFNNSVNDFEVLAYPSDTDTSINRYLRFSKLVITPSDYTSAVNLSMVKKQSDRIVLEVSKFFDTNTTDWGVSRFSSIISAHNSINEPYFNGDSKFTVRLMPGTYDEFEIVWAGVDGESDTDYKGIIVKNNVNFESFDVDNPELTVLKWDGHAGFSNGYIMDTETQAMTRCIFHITKNPCTTKIDGFKIISKNTRYCIHPESASIGNGNTWMLKNLLLDWGGRPEVESEGGSHLGIGISSGELGIIENVKFIGITGLGIGGHNNGWSEYNLGVKPFMVPGARLTLRNLDLNGNSVVMDTYQNDATTYDILELENVVNVNVAGFGLTPPATAQNWRAIKKACEITTDNLI